MSNDNYHDYFEDRDDMSSKEGFSKFISEAMKKVELDFDTIFIKHFGVCDLKNARNLDSVLSHAVSGSPEIRSLALAFVARKCDSDYMSLQILLNSVYNDRSESVRISAIRLIRFLYDKTQNKILLSSMLNIIVDESLDNEIRMHAYLNVIDPSHDHYKYCIMDNQALFSFPEDVDWEYVNELTFN